MTNTTAPQVGCYVDEARGAYMIDRIVEIAEQHGMNTPAACEDTSCQRCHDGQHTAGDGSHSEWSLCLFSSEIESECDDFMNTRHPVAGHYWGTGPQGDWGLWQDEEEG